MLNDSTHIEIVKMMTRVLLFSLQSSASLDADIKFLNSVYDDLSKIQGVRHLSISSRAYIKEYEGIKGRRKNGMMKTTVSIT